MSTRTFSFKNTYIVASFFLIVMLIIQNQQLKRVMAKELSITELGLDQVYTIQKGNAPVLGFSGSPVQMVVFSDFACPYCMEGAASMARLIEKYPGKLEVVFKHLPSVQGQTGSPALCSMAAFAQGKFWEMHDLLFFSGTPLSESSYFAHAESLGLDLEQFRKDMQNLRWKEHITSDIQEANNLGIVSVPTFFINGIKVTSPSFDKLDHAINLIAPIVTDH